MAVAQMQLVLSEYQYQIQLLSELNLNHLSMSRMKSVARSYTWWPQLNSDLIFKLTSSQLAMPLFPDRGEEYIHTATHITKI